MTQAQLRKFIIYLQKNDWSVFGPVLATDKTEEISPFLTAHQPESAKTNISGEILVKHINRPKDLRLDGQLPFYPFKRFFVPEKETLFEYKKSKLIAKKHAPKTALVGINILDLKAVNLYDQVFEKDPYYQIRRRNILIVGYSLTPEISDNIFEEKFEEDILEHLPFDIFLGKLKPPGPPLRKGGENPTVAPLVRGGENPTVAPLVKGGSGGFKVFTGSIKGQRILEHFGYSNYEHIQFSGPVKEGKPDERMERLRDRLKNHHNFKIWEELGKICIECGKCTLACPTCFCFRVEDEPFLNNDEGQRTRCWDSCYYQEFSEVAGPERTGFGKPKFLSTTAQRLHFWYFHKFARIPDEFDFMGCVGCGRCTAVCPVGIDIVEVLKQIETT